MCMLLISSPSWWVDLSTRGSRQAGSSATGYFLFGYAFAYGDSFDEDGNASGNPFIGSKLFALSGLSEDEYYKWLFQFVFAISTATIISGAVAERLKFTAVRPRYKDCVVGFRHTCGSCYSIVLSRHACISIMCER